MSSSKGIDMKPTLLYKDEKETVPFKSIVVPSTMRSALWKYFGFPANENRGIITKSKIVCCICYSYIAYNKNTTNLSTHLSCKHPEFLNEINNSKVKSDDCTAESKSDAPSAKRRKSNETINWYSYDDQGDPSPDDQNDIKFHLHPTGITEKTYVESKLTRSTYKPKFQSSENVIILNDRDQKYDAIDDVSNDQDSQFIETIEYNHIDMSEDGHEIIAEVLEESSTANQSTEEFVNEDYLTINETNKLYLSPSKEVASVSPSKITNKIKAIPEVRQHSEIVNQIKNFLIKDLISPNIVDGTGFKEMIAFFNPNFDIPNSIQVEKLLNKDYGSQNSIMRSGIESLLHQNQFSLSFHKLGNSAIVEVSVNYRFDIDGRSGPLENQIFSISKDYISSIVKLGDSLKKCTAFVVDFDLDNNFEKLSSHGIPIIPTFSYVTKTAFDACMQLSVVRNSIDSLDETFLEIFKKSNTWLQKLEHLSQLLNDSANGNNQIIQTFVECLQPLKNCLSVLAFESSTYASIMKPIALQLINQYYSDNMASDSNDSDISILEKDLKRTIQQTFEQHIIEDPFLTMSSFLDPRFQSLTKPDDLKTIHDKLEKSVTNNDTKSTEGSSEVKQKTRQSFGLSSLFSNYTPTPKSKAPKNRFDIEFRSYTEDVSLDMELCPLEWWADNESLYPNIKHHVKKYFCVPSFVNSLHRLSLDNQEELHRKYDQIENDTNEQLLWLHLTELRQRFCES